MRVLLANLKHLYQRRLLWVAYTYFGIMALWPSSDASWQREAEAVWALALTAGFVVGMMSSEMIAKSFTWCLPGHLLAIRKVAFLLGVVIGGLTVVPVVRLPHAPAQDLIWVAVSASCGSAIAYFSGIGATLFVPKRDTFRSGWPTLLAWGVIISGMILATRSRLGSLVFGYPLWLVLIGSLFGLSLWTAFGHRYGFPARAKFSLPSKLAVAAFVVLLIQIAYGGFTAGLKAGYVSDTWPLMFGRLLPPNLFSSPGNILEVPQTVVFFHRWFAWTGFLAVPAVYWAAKKRSYPAGIVRGLTWLAGFVALQITLGILTVISHVSIPIGLMHQANAIILFALGIYFIHRLRARDAGQPGSAEAIVPQP